MPPKGSKKPPVVAAVVPVVIAPDAAAGLYRDKSGPARGLPMSEGKDNFGAVTAEAHKTVALANAGELTHAG